jgi:hypothetical protein
MATDLSDLLAAVKSTGTPGAVALVGIYAGSTAHMWQTEFQFYVSATGLAFLSGSGVWFAGMFFGRMTNASWLRRLEGAVPELPAPSATPIPSPPSIP